LAEIYVGVYNVKIDLGEIRWGGLDWIDLAQVGSIGELW
jgi:hypothetical protein